MSTCKRFLGSTLFLFVIVVLLQSSAIADPPYVPHQVFPMDNSTQVDRTVILEWLGGDPDGDDVTYDVYFGTLLNPPLVRENWSGNYFNPFEELNAPLEESTTYFWQIIAEDENGETAESDLYSFTTDSFRDFDRLTLD